MKNSYNSTFMKEDPRRVVMNYRAYCDGVAEAALIYIASVTPKRSGETASNYSIERTKIPDGMRYAIMNPFARIVRYLEFGTPAHGAVSAAFMQWTEYFDTLHKGNWRRYWVKGIKPHGFVQRTRDLVLNLMRGTG